MPHAWSSSAISSSVLILRASSITRDPSVTWTPARCSASSVTMSAMSTPTGSPSRPRSRSSKTILSARRSGTPVSTGIAPRIGATPARKFSGGSHGANSWWCRAAEPKSQRIGSLAAQQQHPARVLVARPLADVRARDVADVVRVEEQQRAEIGGLEHPARAGEPVGPQAREVDALLPVDGRRRATRCDVRQLFVTSFRSRAIREAGGTAPGSPRRSGRSRRPARAAGADGV